MAAFDYTSRDYNSIRADLLARASEVLPEWTSRDSSDFGILFVDLVAYMGDIFHYYLDEAAKESPDLICGDDKRSSEFVDWKLKRPLSHNQPQFTGSLSTPW